MPPPIDGITNWMHLFRWIVKLIRDDYGVDEKILTRNALLETDIGLDAERLEEVLDDIAKAWGITFPENTTDEILRLEELCLLVSWIKGLYKRPEFIGDAFEARCRAVNAIAA